MYSLIFRKPAFVSCCIQQSPNGTHSNVAAYNSALFLSHAFKDLIDLSINIQNEALHTMFPKSYGDVFFSDINKLYAYGLSSLTGSLTEPGNKGMAMDCMRTNLVPFRGLNHCAFRVSPDLRVSHNNPKYEANVWDQTHNLLSK